jgi:peptidyl-prolyl cis-trans isomerase C
VDVVSSRPALCELAQIHHSSARRILRRCLREPLVHFLLIGSLLFVIYRVWGHSSQGGSNHIQLTLNDVRRLEIGFAAQWQRGPTPEELSGLVESQIREEVLYREALALGLDKDDDIVKRRMAQKMRFLAEDMTNAHEPTTAELNAWFKKNESQFIMPGRITFHHAYFSPDQRGGRAHDDAVKALARITGKPQGSRTAAALADPFMFQDYYADRSPEQLTKDFGSQFAKSLFKLRPGLWQGPVESGYGWHLVFVDSFTSGRIPDFEEIEPDVKNAWLADQRDQAWNKAYAAMRGKYTVSLPAPNEKQTASVPAPPLANREMPTMSGERPQ